MAMLPVNLHTSPQPEIRYLSPRLASLHLMSLIGDRSPVRHLDRLIAATAVVCAVREQEVDQSAGDGEDKNK